MASIQALASRRVRDLARLNQVAGAIAESLEIGGIEYPTRHRKAEVLPLLQLEATIAFLERVAESLAVELPDPAPDEAPDTEAAVNPLEILPAEQASKLIEAGLEPGDYHQALAMLDSIPAPDGSAESSASETEPVIDGGGEPTPDGTGKIEFGTVIPSDQTPADDSNGDMLDKMTVAELKLYAEANGIDISSANRKQEIIDVIREVKAQVTT